MSIGLAVEFDDGAGLGRINAADDLDEVISRSRFPRRGNSTSPAADIERDILERLNPAESAY